MAIRRDHKVAFIPDAAIAKIAARVRSSAAMDHCACIDVVAILFKLTRTEILQKGRLKLVPLLDEEVLPYVTYNPLELHIDEETVENARLGDEESRYKIAHEIGHIILHDHHAQPFSFDPAIHVPFVQNQESAEWQANRFAYHLLAPEDLVRYFGCDAIVVHDVCGVPQQVADDRVAEVKRIRRGYVGEACPECANFTLVRNGTCLKCDTCGSTTGCS